MASSRIIFSGAGCNIWTDILPAYPITYDEAIAPLERPLIFEKTVQEDVWKQTL
jgi:hypothetical protein